MRLQAVLWLGLILVGCQNNSSSSKVADASPPPAQPIATTPTPAPAPATAPNAAGYKVVVQDGSGNVVYSAPVDATQDGSLQVKWQLGETGPVFSTGHPSLLLPTHGLGHGATAICDQGAGDCIPP